MLTCASGHHPPKKLTDLEAGAQKLCLLWVCAARAMLGGPCVRSNVHRHLGCSVLIISFLEKQTQYVIRHCCLLSLIKMFITKEPKGYQQV